MKKLLLILSLLAMLACEKENGKKSFEWTDVSPESTTYFQDIQMLNENVGYVAGTISNEPTNLACTQILTGVTSPISLDNTMPDLSCVVPDALSSASIMFKTEDGGKSWSPVTLPFSKYKHMSFVDEYLGFVLSGDGLYKTVNGGLSWQKIMENSVIYDHTIRSNTFQKVKFTGPDNGFLYTNNFMGGCVLVSVNGDGELKKIISNRIELPAPIPYINGIENIPSHPEEALILTQRNLYKYDENGEELELMQNTNSFEKLAHACGSTWYASFSGILSVSGDTGTSWNNISTLPVSNCSILTIAGENCVCVSNKIGIYISDNGGLNFRQMSKPDVEITDICFPTPQTGLAIGPNGRILRYFHD